MAGASTKQADDILNWFFRQVTLTQPTQMWVSLHSTDPGTDGSNEIQTPGSNGYARIQYNPTQTNWSAPAASGSTREIHNLNQIVFGPVPSGVSWGTVNGVGLWISATLQTAANFRVGGSTTQLNMGTGATYTFDVAGLSLTQR